MKIHRRHFALGAALAPALAQSAWAQTSNGWRHPELDRALSLIRVSGWRDLSVLLANLPPQRARDLLSALGEEVPFSADLASITSHPMIDTVAAAVQVGWAWRNRGHGVASTVTRDGLVGFVENLNRAKTNVVRAIQSDPDDGVARAIDFTICMGLSDLVGLSNGLQGYLLSARRPVGGLSAFANAISRKWLGTEEAALSCARETCLVDLPASAGIVPDVHFNAWQSRAMADAASAGDFASYAAQPEVRAELIAANQSFNSVGPDPDQFANWYANAWFSFVLITLNEPDLAGPHLQNMGSYLGGPWADLPDARRTIEALRHRLGLEAL